MCHIVCREVSGGWQCGWECDFGQVGARGISQIVIGKWKTTITNPQPPKDWEARLVPTLDGNELHLIPREQPYIVERKNRQSFSFKATPYDGNLKGFRWDMREAETRVIKEQGNIEQEK